MNVWFFLTLAATAQEHGPAPQVPASARGESAYDDGEAHVRGYLITDVSRVTAGETLRAGILYQMDPGWHIYWQDPGEAAIPTELSVETLQGSAGAVQWPMPSVFRESNGFITTFGYAGEVLLFSEVEVTDDSGVLELSVKSDFLACKVECVPGSLELTRTIPLGSSTAPSSEQDLFTRFASRVPQLNHDPKLQLTTQTSPSPVGPNQAFTTWLEVRCASCTTLELGGPVADTFVPRGIAGVNRLEPLRVIAIENGLAIEMSSESGADVIEEPQALTGVLALVVDGAPVQIEVASTLPRAASSGGRAAPTYAADSSNALLASTGPSGSLLSIWQVLLFALLGGLLLNLMPCVLPVLAIKIVSFAELAHKDRREVLLYSAAYGVAVVGSMLALAALVVALKAAGTSIGWGFQFQSPLFVAIVGGLLVAFALNLFGVFEVMVGAGSLGAAADQATGVRRSFLEGVLAVILATPCTAPLLGSAVGFALSQSPWVIFSVFGIIGVGLAAPFVVLTLIPGGHRFVPKPGNWMVTLKHVLAFALLASAVWLAWIVGRGYGPDAMAGALAFFVAVGVAAWAFGRWQLAPIRARFASIGFAALLLVAAGVGFLRFDAVASEAGLDWQAFNDEAIGRDLAEGKPVFVNFTADWCITCKVNEQTVLTLPSVQKAADFYDIALYKADWTRRDPEIERALARYGKAGVPAYVLYNPRKPRAPLVLPELLSVDVLEEAFASVAQ